MRSTHDNNIVILISSSVIVLLLSSFFLYTSAAAHTVVNTQYLILSNELLSNIVRKEYNLDMNNDNEMSEDTYNNNNDNDNQIPNEGGFKSKRGVEVHPSNETSKELNATDKIQDIPRPGVPDEAKFRELKDKANRNLNTSEEGTTGQENSAMQDDT